MWYWSRRKSIHRRSAFTFCTSEVQASIKPSEPGVALLPLKEGRAGVAEEDPVGVGLREARGDHPDEARDDQRGVAELIGVDKEKVEDKDVEADVDLRIDHVVAERRRLAEDVNDVRRVREICLARRDGERGAEDSAYDVVEESEGAGLDCREQRVGRRAVHPEA